MGGIGMVCKRKCGEMAMDDVAVHAANRKAGKRPTRGKQ